MWNNNEVKTENFQKLVVGCCQKVKHCNLLGDKNLSVLHFSSSMSPCQLNVDYVSVWTSVSFSSVQKSKYNYYSSTYKSGFFKIFHKEGRAIDSKEYLLSYIGLVFLFLLPAHYLNFVEAVKSSKVTCYVARYPAQTLTVYRDVHIS